jgi:alpha/beta superfamily hydrolase
VNPILFGSAPKSLFGVYHPPKADQARSTGVVLCYPFGQEYMRAHRAFRQMAMQLSRAGFHVLRFDYFGTGDSSGEATDASFDQWVDDANVAADELEATAEVSRVAFIGLRLGAAIAAAAAARRTDVEAVVMWDPVVHGEGYLAELLLAPTDSLGNSRLSALPDGTVGVIGFPIADVLRDGIARINLLEVDAPARSRRLVVVGQERDEYRAISLARPNGISVGYQLVPTEGNWNDVDDYGGAMIPVMLMRAIVGWCAGELP